MSSDNKRFTYNRFSNVAVAVEDHGNIIEVKSWTQLSSAGSEVNNWDGTVLLGVDFDAIYDDLQKGIKCKAYLDENVVCGGLPRGMGYDEKTQLKEFATAISEIFSAPRWVEGAFAARIALEWKKLNFKELSQEELLSLAKEIYPAVNTVAVTPNGNLWAPNPTIRGLEVSKASMADAVEVGVLLSKNGSKVSTKQAMSLIEDGLIVIRNFNDTLTATASIKGKSGDYENRPDNKKLLSLIDSLIKQSAKGDFEGQDGYCYTCKSVKSCKCATTATKFKTMMTSAVENIGGDTQEHRWGDKFCSRPTVQNIISAGKLSTDVRNLMLKNHASEVSNWEKTLGREVWFDIAVFLDQCGQDEKVLDSFALKLMKELMKAQARVKSIHNYAETLYLDFDSQSSSLMPGYNEIYLGRDAIFSYFARQAQRATMRKLTPVNERNEKFNEFSDIRYIVVSRTAEWIQGIHTSKLGDRPCVFIDTGYSGSIPRAIASKESIKIFDRAGKKGPKMILGNGTAQVRLMQTTNLGYQFAKQWSGNSVTQIEHDAKPTYTAKAVDEAKPTSALEQLVFRVLRRGISNLASSETEVLLRKNEGVGAIRTYSDVQRFLAEQDEKYGAVVPA